MSRERRDPAKDPSQFEVHEVVRRVREAVAPLPKPVMVALADEGYRSLFEQVVACIISARTKEEVTAVVARRLFAVARTPLSLAALPVGVAGELLRQATFAEVKASRILEVAKRTLEQFGGTLPCDEAVIRSLPGVGPKCANLALGIVCGMPLISVDVHVHRVTNRWGLVSTRTPEATTKALKAALPPEYWGETNRLLVPFGKYICTGERPRCSVCPVRPFCPQVGVASQR